MLDPVTLGARARPEHDHRAPEGTSERNLREGAPLAADGHRRLARSDDREVSGMARAGGDRVVDPGIGVPHALSGQDPDRRPSRALGSTCRRFHDLSEPAAHHHTPALAQQATDLLRLRRPLRAAADDRDLHGPMI